MDAPEVVRGGRDLAVEMEMGAASLRSIASASDNKACTAGDSDEFRGERSGSGDVGGTGVGSSEDDSERTGGCGSSVYTDD